MRKSLIIVVVLCLNFVAAWSQVYDFESAVTPASILNGGGQLELSPTHYKNGAMSLKWSWTNASCVVKLNNPITLNNFRNGAIFWVYNETPLNTYMLCSYRNSSGVEQASFKFYLNFKGWRACRFSSSMMAGNRTASGVTLHLVAPIGVASGTLFIDRLSFVTDVDYRSAPDAQTPNNMSPEYLTHWSKIYKWESTFSHDLPLPTSLTSQQTQANVALITALDNYFVSRKSTATAINKAKTGYTALKITKNGTIITGKPLVPKDDKKNSNDINYADLGAILFPLACDAVYNNNAPSREKVLLLWQHAVDQGFAYNSSMGNNTHYGYDAKDIFNAVYILKDILSTEGLLEEAAKTLSYWSGLPEARLPYDYTRDSVVDSWNTLLLARLIAAAITPNTNERYRNFQSLIRWIDGSFLPTAGTTGGIKVDGTIFHHGGHYPAYGADAFKTLGIFFQVINETPFSISVASRRSLRNALIAATRYSNLTDWTIGVGGRHPHKGSLSPAAIECMGYLALAGGIDDPTAAFDQKMAATYLRLQTATSPLRTKVVTAGGVAEAAPQGFYTFNYGAAGNFWSGNAMAAVKGYNNYVWGSEIYTADNRYGRYQSYGAIELFASGNPVSRDASRFREAGWNWSCLPGTTTIIKPNEVLNSPVTGTWMEKSVEQFAGVSSLKGQYGVFGIKLKEGDKTNFTPSFVARKSTFFFNNEIICLGTDIANTESAYETTTTLFQNALNNTSETYFSGTAHEIAYNADRNNIPNTPTLISDVVGNYYRIAPNQKIVITGSTQYSNTNTKMDETSGDFIVARLSHGNAPTAARYEYMIAMQPDATQIAAMQSEAPYQVVRQDNKAHIISHTATQARGYVFFETLQEMQDPYLSYADGESLIMIQKTASQTIDMSIGVPMLNFGVVATTGAKVIVEESRPIAKSLCLKGTWHLTTAADTRVTFSYVNNLTYIDVTLQHGIPLNISLINQSLPTSASLEKKNNIKMVLEQDKLFINGECAKVKLYNENGVLLYSDDFTSFSREIDLPLPAIYLLTYQVNGGLFSTKISKK